MKEKKYAIYFTGASWKQDGLDHYNSTGFSKMYKEDPGISSVRQESIDWIASLFKKDKYKDKNCELVSLSCRFVEHETWCLHWFNHYTYNIHLSDSELRISFAAFVDRKKILLGEKACLMGADDAWRWEGPCRCGHCQTRGVVYIDH